MNDPRETLNRIRKQADNATKGPWVYTLNGDESEVTYANAPITWDDHGGEVFTEGDAEFIAAARTTVPALLDALEKVLRVHRDGGESQGYDMAHGGDYRTMPHCCTECGSLGEYGVPWPCDTVEAITTALDAIK